MHSIYDPCTCYLEKADGIHDRLHGCGSLRHCTWWIGKHAVASTAYVDLAQACRSRSFGAHWRWGNAQVARLSLNLKLDPSVVAVQRRKM
jgi:hypothetical protein